MVYCMTNTLLGSKEMVVYIINMFGKIPETPHLI